MNDLANTASFEARNEELLGPDVKERHIDFLLQEEFNVNSMFLSRFVQAAARGFAETAAQNDNSHNLPAFIDTALQPGAEFELVRVRHSVSDVQGEADLILLYRPAKSNERVAILIEDKIRAPFQDRQATRYKERGELGMKAGKWNNYWTCLVAPECYVQRGHGFDSAVKLEEVKSWFSSNDPGRLAFKIGVVEKAIKKASITGVKVVDDVMSMFRVGYYAAFMKSLNNQSQTFKMRPPLKDYGDAWFKFRSTGELLPRGAYINHKAPSGFVDLTFPNIDARRMKASSNLASILEPGMTIEQTGKSAAIRLHVPKIEDFRSFEDQATSVEVAFSAVRRLLAFYVRERVKMDSLLLAARTGPSDRPA